MTPRSRPAALIAAALLGLPASAAAAAGSAKPKRKAPTVNHVSRLWATVNACNPKDHADTIGIRGSMPGDGHADETMYMRFRIQYRDARTGSWLFVPQNADSGWISVGSARYATRQDGRSFVIVPSKGQQFVLRGAVSFVWRRGGKELRSARIHTTAGHGDAAGGDPKGYSAASCTI